MDMSRLPVRSALSRLTLAAIGFTGMALASGCSDDSLTASAIPNTPNFSTAGYKSIKSPVGDPMKLVFPMEALTRNQPLKQPISRSFAMDQKGGRMEIKELGLRVEVPPGAITGKLTITVTGMVGDAVAYDFQPHGTVFLKPLQFNQDLVGTSWERSDYKGSLLGGYFELEAQVNALPGLSLLDELFPVTLDGKRASFDIRHFSGYMVSSGRQQARNDEF